MKSQKQRRDVCRVSGDILVDGMKPRLECAAGHSPREGSDRLDTRAYMKPRHIDSLADC